MKVRELIEELGKHNPGAEVMHCDEDGWCRDIDKSRVTVVVYNQDSPDDEPRRGAPKHVVLEGR